MSIIIDKIEVSYINKNELISDVWAKHIKIESEKKLNIFAASGSGKTSLFNTITAIKKPDKGQVLIDGKDIHRISIDELINLRKEIISLVFQDLKLLSSLTVLDNFKILDLKMCSGQKEKLENMMGRLNISDKKDVLISRLSQGEKQRVAIIRSLIRPFNYLILDEPFSHLDEFNKKAAISLIEEEVSCNKASLIMLSLQKEDFIKWDMQMAL